MRTEILLPKPARDSIQAIAQSEGTRYLETVSALAQLGLATYQGQAADWNMGHTSLYPPTEPQGGVLRSAFNTALAGTPACAPTSAIDFASDAGGLPAEPLFGATASAVAPAPAAPRTSPLARFLKSRKDSSHECF